jgi:acetyl-CoA synthetase
MPSILDVRTVAEARRRFTWDVLWELFDGDRERLNLSHECVDRHAGRGRTALRIQFDDGHREEYGFDELAAWSSRFAHFLAREGVGPGDRVAIALDPCLTFYGAMFGTVKRGAIAVPLFTLFGPDGLALRMDDCRPRLLVVGGDAERWGKRFPEVKVVAAGELDERLAGESPHYEPETRSGDLAVFQYTSGTTRALPEAVQHRHRAVVTLMVAALYGVGLEAGDRYFCPSSPAWGHGLWHGTIAPLALGVAAGAYSGRFEARRLLDALAGFEIDNLAAAPTVYRLLRNSGLTSGSSFRPRKLSYTGEPMDSATFAWAEQTWGLPPCGMYGSTEVGVLIVNYPGFPDYEVRPGALGQSAPGWDVTIVDAEGRPLPPGAPGEIAVRRKGGWFPVKDRGWRDADGYFYHAGRSDDVIISAGWTMSAVEIEDALLRHPDVREAAVVGVPDEVRGQVVKAFVVSARRDPGFAGEIQSYVRDRLSRHEYPRHLELVAELPKTPAGKVDRGALRERERRAGADPGARGADAPAPP